MSLRQIRFCAAVILSAFCLLSGTAAPPNIIVILVDDLGWADLGCQGSQFHLTPHIDRMAREGMRFTDAYSACTVCSPTRAALLTGKHPARLHLTDWIPGHAAPRAKLSPPEWTPRLDVAEPTLASRLKSAGYATAAIGKWHLGEGTTPEQFGFDLNLGGDQRGQPPRYVSPYGLPKLPDGPSGEFLTDRESAEAMRFIEAHRERPFFLQLWHYAVHTPIAGKPEAVKRFQARKGDDQRNPVYAALLESVDESVGRIRAQLERLGVATNTVLVFTSDNGGLVLGGDARPTSNRPLRSGKGDVYEGGVRVPFIVVWPGVVRGGTTSSKPVQTVDVYPTLLEAAGVPDVEGHERDGISLVGTLRGQGGGPDRSLYWHYPHYHPGGATPYGAVRSGDWKLVEFYETGHLELYHLASDLGETTDLANAIPEKANELARELAGWRKRVGAQMPVINAGGEPWLVKEEAGRVVLEAHRAVPHGKKIQYEPPAHKNTVGYWVEADDWVSWTFSVGKPGAYEVEILQGCGTGSGGSEVELSVGESRLRFEVVETGGFQKFMPRRLGELEIRQGGVQELQVRVMRKAGPAVMDVRRILLRRK
jgi:arylsulfatase A-like enzyme